MEEIKKRDCYETPQYLADWAVAYGHQKVVRVRAAEVLRSMGCREGLLITNLTEALSAPYHMMEPGCGESAPFCNAALKRGYKAHAVEYRILDFLNKDILTSNVDFLLSYAEPARCAFDLIATNPPFSQAEPFIRRSLELLKPYGVAVFLLRLGFLASLKRRVLYRDRPPSAVHVLQHRPSFSHDGRTDAQEYAFYTWMGSAIPVEHTTLEWLDTKSLYEAWRSNSSVS